MDYGAEIIILVFIAFLIYIVFFIRVYLPFKEKRDYIKMEMKRSISENEYLYWKKKLKMLYISKIPIMRTLFKKEKKKAD